MHTAKPSGAPPSAPKATRDDDNGPSCPAHVVAGLRYVDDRRPGIRRVRTGDAEFDYVDAKGKRIENQRVLARIKALAIPPAYEDVWICPIATGHIQATARDARGRKQYRYHPQWTAVRDANKYDHLAEFARALPRIRRAVARDLATPGFSLEKVAAVLVRLLEMTLIRIGTRAYARSNKSYGLTTLKRRHTTVAGSRIRFRFRGKSGVSHDVTVVDLRVARIVRRCLEIPGQQLFHYRDAEGRARAIDSGAVNAYLKQISGCEFTAKHYRTWAASLLAHAALERSHPGTLAERRHMIVQTVREVAERLGNTPSVCRACYIHPAITEAFLEGRLDAARRTSSAPRGLSAAERRLLTFLEEDKSQQPA